MKRTPAVTHPARTVAVVAVLLAVAVAVPVLVWRAVDTMRTSKAGRIVETTRLRPQPLPDTPASVLVLTDRTSTPVGLVVVAGAPGGGGTILPLPLAAETTVSTAGDAAPLGAAWAAGGLDAEADAVASLLGISVSRRYAVGEEELAALLRPVAPLEVTLASDVRDTDASGRARVVQPAGTRRLSAAEAAQVLLARAPDEPELARLGRVAAVWKAVASSAAAMRPSTPPAATAALEGTEAPATTAAAPSSAAEVFAGVLSGPVRVHVVPVTEEVLPPRRPTGVPELLRLDDADLRLVVAEVLPGAVSPSNDEVRFRILDPFGDRDVVRKAVERLAFIGANVVLVQQGGTPGPSSRLEYDGEQVGASLTGYDRVLGSVEMVPASERIEGVDATIVLGESFRRLVASELATTTTTTTTTSPTTSRATGTTAPTGRATTTTRRP